LGTSPHGPHGMLSRQVAPLLRKFCKVSAYFTITTQRCHALTMLRSLKVILNFRTHALVFDTPN
jgi:hypothetical protein